MQDLADNRGTLLLGRNYVHSSYVDSFTNSGTVALDQAALFHSSVPVTNLGTFRAANNSVILVYGDFVNGGAGSVSLTTLALLQLEGGTYQQNGGQSRTILQDGQMAVSLVDLRSGVLEGSGWIIGDLTNAAEIVVGERGTAGLLSVEGNYTQEESGVLHVDIGGLDWGLEHDLLTVQGTASLSGILSVSLINDFIPEDGDLIAFLCALGGIKGDFLDFWGLDPEEGLTFLPFHDGTCYYLQAQRN